MKQRKINDNALKAQLRTPMFKMQQQTPKKGKGSYCRKNDMDKRGGHQDYQQSGHQGYSQVA